MKIPRCSVLGLIVLGCPPPAGNVRLCYDALVATLPAKESLMFTRSSFFALGAFVFAATAQATCPSDVQIVSELTCSSSITGTISATADNKMGGECEDSECYTCGDPWIDQKQIAPEHVYSFECQDSGTVRLLITDLPCDMDIYALDSSCDPYTGCLHGSTAPFSEDDEVIFDCTAGETHYIVIEAYGTEHLDVASGPCTDDGTATGNVFDPSYTLSFDVSASTGCFEDCDDGSDNDFDGDVDCDDSDCGADPVCCDVDGDGFFSEGCGGTDCDDNDADINPVATDVPDNGVDEDCSGTDEVTASTGDGDTGADGEGKDKDGPCGCGVTSTEPMKGQWMFLALGFGLILRRRQK